MSAESDFVSGLHLTDPWIKAITPERIATALDGFVLPLAQGWDFARLTRSIQDTADSARGKTPQGNADAIAELQELAKKAKALHLAISRMGDTADSAAFWEVFRHLQESLNADEVRYEEDYKRLMLQPLETISNILSRAASQTGTQRKQMPGWRKKHNQERRINFAMALTPVFQSAFNTPARANNWGAEYGEEHPWPDFYKRVYCELFPNAERLNIPEVLQEAMRELPKLEAIQNWLDEQEATLPKISDE